MMEKLAQAGEGGGRTARPSPFTIVTITYKVAVYAAAERADTLLLFVSTPMYSVVVPNVQIASLVRNLYRPLHQLARVLFSSVQEGPKRGTVKIKILLLWKRFSQLVRALDSQSRNNPEFNPSIFRHRRIQGVADEAVLNKKIKKILLINKVVLTPLR
jgi:hypothetical protein